VPATQLLAQLGATPGLAAILDRLGVGEDSVSPGQVAAAVEFVLEGLHLTRRLSKVEADGQTIYGS
jgi:magnesium chelatase subunit I